MDIIVKVVAKDIKLGKRSDSKRCPIARAVRKLAKFKTVAVYDDEVYANSKRGELCEPHYFNLPIRAQKFIEKFDDGKPVKPFQFKLKSYN